MIWRGIIILYGGFLSIHFILTPIAIHFEMSLCMVCADMYKLSPILRE